MRRRDDGGIESWVLPHPEICSHGIIRGAVLVMMVDVGAGFVAEQCSGDDWSFTVDIGIRRQPTVAERIDGVPVVQRAGRTVSIDVPMTDHQGRATASGVATFIRLPRRAHDPARPDFPPDSVLQWAPADAPLEELLDATSTSNGLAVELRPDLLNPAGILQGGVTALLAELAAQRQLETAGGRNLVVTGFDVRYITMGRVGPFEAVVEPIGPDMAAVRVVDRGADDAVVTHNLLNFTADFPGG